MTDSTEAKKETVRITLPPLPAATSPSAPATRDAVRINLPSRPPSNEAMSAAGPPIGKTPIPSPPNKPIQPPPFVAPSPLATAKSKVPISSPAAAALPLPVIPPSASDSPKNETERITVLSDPPSKSAVQMKKAQPLIDMPAAAAPDAPITTAPEPEPVVDVIPKPLCWALVSLSTAVLIIQILNYVS